MALLDACTLPHLHAVCVCVCVVELCSGAWHCMLPCISWLVHQHGKPFERTSSPLHAPSGTVVNHSVVLAVHWVVMKGSE
jgi:hypothetical protein